MAPLLSHGTLSLSTQRQRKVTDGYLSFAEIDPKVSRRPAKVIVGFPNSSIRKQSGERGRQGGRPVIIARWARSWVSSKRFRGTHQSRCGAPLGLEILSTLNKSLKGALNCIPGRADCCASRFRAQRLCCVPASAQIKCCKRLPMMHRSRVQRSPTTGGAAAMKRKSKRWSRSIIEQRGY